MIKLKILPTIIYLKSFQFLIQSRAKYTHFAEISKCNPTVKLHPESFSAADLPHLHIELGTLKDLCNEFGCDYQEVVIERTLQILRTKELRFDVVVDELGVERIQVLTSVQSILDECMPLVNELGVERIGQFSKRLLQFAETIDSYFYEMYLALLELITLRHDLPPKYVSWRDILAFLQHKMVTRRRVRPSQAETEWWSSRTTQNEASVLPKIAKYRFPFMRLQESLTDTLGDEIHVENCVSWFPLVNAFVASADRIDHEIEGFCARAVKNSIGEWKVQREEATQPQHRNEDVWHLVPVNNDFLQSILRLVAHIRSEGKAFSILYYTMNHMPEGADQVAAAFECHQFMLEHEARLAQHDKYRDAVAKMRRKYPLLKTQHLLHVYRMAEDGLMALIERPLDLIASLYLHAVVLAEEGGGQRPNVKGLVTEIAEVHHLPLHSIEVMLLRKLLHLDEEEVEQEQEQGQGGGGGGSGDGGDMNGLAMDDDASVVMIMDATELLEVHESLQKALERMPSCEVTRRVNYVMSDWTESLRLSFLMTQMLRRQNAASTAELAKYIQLYECLAEVPLVDGDGDAKQMVDVFAQDDFVTCKIVYLLHRIGFQYDRYSSSSNAIRRSRELVRLISVD